LTLRRWSLDVAGSPFEALLSADETELRLAAADGGTEVALTMRQSPRGWARFGGTVLRRAAKRTLDAALDGLAQTVSQGTDAGRSTGSRS
jgi:hypothetical protein